MRPPSFVTHCGTVTRPSAQRSKSFAYFAAIAVFVSSMLVLAGWTFGVEELTSLLPGLPPMKANTAICLGLLAAAVGVSARSDAPPPWVIVLTVLAGSIAALSIAETWFATDFGIDQLLFVEAASPVHPHPGRMAPITGIAIAFLAIAVAVRSNARLPSLWWQMCAILPFAFGMLAVIGHAYGVHYLPSETTPFATMAVPTALSIMALGLASLATEPDSGILRIILADRFGGRFARLVLPVAILFPIVIGWFRLLGQNAGLYDTKFGVLIMALSAIVVFSVISILSARWLNRSEDELLEAQHTLERRVQERTVELETTVTRLRAEIVLREAAEKAHADSRQFLSDVIDAIPIQLTVKDDQRRLIIVNDANDRFHGRPSHDIVGKLDTDLFPPDLAEQYWAEDDAVLESGEPMIQEQAFTTMSGELRWVIKQKRRIALSDGRRWLIVTLLDITNRKKAEAALAEREEALNRFKYMLDSSLDTILLYDADTLRFNYVNDGAVKTLGYPKEKLLGMAPWELRGDISITDYHKSIEPFLRGDIQSRKFESMYRRADGELIPMDVSMQLVRRAGEPGTFIAVARDATERRAVERLKNEFVSTVSHELRTPVTSIRGSLGLLAGGVAGELPEQARQLVDIAYKNSERLIRLINDILDIEKIESGKMRFAMRPVVLRSLLETPLADNRGYAEQFGVNFVLRGEIPDVLVQVDPDRIMQVMANLLSNAAKFSPRGADVEISAVAASVSVRISVTDHGGGIPQEFQSRIFGKFSQADASDSRKMGGSGLGLSIAKAIVEKHSGTISFTSTSGGTTFFFDLPIALSGQKAEDDATGSVSDPVVN